MTGFPTVVRSRLRIWSVTGLVLGTLLAGTALAVAGTDRKSDEYGEMGASPIPVPGAVAGPTKFRVSSFPTFLAVDEQGEARLVRSGIEAGQATWFVEFLEKADAAVQSEDSVLAARKKSPLDARAALNAGLWYAAHRRPVRPSLPVPAVLPSARSFPPYRHPCPRLRSCCPARSAQQPAAGNASSRAGTRMRSSTGDKL